ncbi:hypothetical protein [Halopiger xanaduensis]|uniref:Major facilitator superfamily (MFS) profile domain-containing protein n=1 Tax=Halopiger xanaduensis (strain DSM 18323 / JCM 14033 / SH-6) TaxID=797210 RepID=F8D411_HALXS|nr:hypothetical protein [Halopiger xanaduensis]AEH36264.1 hypothetical protein Halxa_1632 [Halopiger xanaduensis SH-6]
MDRTDSLLVLIAALLALILVEIGEGKLTGLLALLAFAAIALSVLGYALIAVLEAIFPEAKNKP